ncbi:MAG: radical SAM protein [Sulfurospirillum sp.]
MSDIIFGPINSRRFGRSLGIDLSPALKQCNFDCVYCELKGAKTVDQMRDIVSVRKVIDALKLALEKHKNIDVITITANGEPTLYPYLDELVDEINKIKQNHKLLILSNGANIVKKDVEDALRKIDIVKLSLDCATKKCFKKIDRPYNSIDLDTIIKAMKSFSKSYKGSLVIEVLVVKGINDKDDEFERLNTILNEIKPDRVDISTIDRPPAYRVHRVSMSRLKELSGFLENLHVSIAYRKDYKGEKESFSEDEILYLISRRPQSEADIELGFDDDSKIRFEKLLEKENIYQVEIAGAKFFKIGERK